jgi:hypothetical protein
MKSARPIVTLPGWPAMMDDALACAYTSLSTESFRAVMAMKKIAPVDMGLRVVRWKKSDLDRVIDSLPLRGSDPPVDQGGVPVIDLGAEAIARAREMRRRQG